MIATQLDLRLICRLPTPESLAKFIGFWDQRQVLVTDVGAHLMSQPPVLAQLSM